MLPDGIAFSQSVGDTESGFTIGGSGGTPPYLMTVAGGTPPPGINFSTSGVITGTYTTAGVFTFIIKATDSLGASGTSTITITVLAAITISPSVLPTIRVGVPFSQQLTATGGTGTGYTWTPTTGTQIPGLAISASGLLSGTPTTAGPYNRGFRVTDSFGNEGNIVYSGTVLPPGVPTMPQWMLIALAILLIVIAVRRLSTPRLARP